MYIVYMHKCPSGKVYIGITGQAPERRWQKGKGYAYGQNNYFYKAIQKYGWDNIEHKILFKGLTKEQAEEKEIELIKKYDSTNRDKGYNFELGGSATPKHTEEYKSKMSEIQKEIWKNSPPERRKKLSEMRKGTHLSEETKEKIRRANIGKKQSEETIEKRISKVKGKKKPSTTKKLKKLWESGSFTGMKGKKGSEKQRFAAMKNQKIAAESAKKPVLQFSKNGEFIREFESESEAIRFLGKPSAKVSEVCRGKRKSTYGYIFKYKEE